MTNYKEKHTFEPSGEKNELNHELCKCGLPLAIPSMHFLKIIKEQPCFTRITRPQIMLNNHRFSDLKCVKCGLEVDSFVMNAVVKKTKEVENGKK